MKQTSQRSNGQTNRSVRLDALPAEVAEELQKLDTDQSGTLSIAEIVESVRKNREASRQLGLAVKVILILAVFTLLQVGAIVGTVWALLVKVKDTDTSTNNGEVILTEKGSDNLVHTGIASQDYILGPDLHDAVLQEAVRVSFTSPTGSFASFKVVGYSRSGDGTASNLTLLLSEVGAVTLTDGTLIFSEDVGGILASAGFVFQNKNNMAGRKLLVPFERNSSSASLSSKFVAFGTNTIDGQQDEPLFYLAENGVTVKCPHAAIGQSGIVDGVTYTKRRRSQIYEWNAATTCTSGIEDMSALFAQFSYEFQDSIASWDTSDVTDMSHLFQIQIFYNEDIRAWDTSKVSNMDYMFEYARLFNQDLAHWCVPLVKERPKNFYTLPYWTRQPRWGTCPGQQE